MAQGRTAPKQLLYLTVTASCLYLGAAVLSFYQFWNFSEVVESYGVPGQIMWEYGRWFVLAGSVFLLFGILSSIVSYGVFKSRKGVLSVWYVLLTCCLVFHLVRLIDGFRSDTFLLVERVFEILFVLLMAIFTLLIVKAAKQTLTELPPAPPETGELG